ncbi:MAG: response regulator [Bacteroidetes bacterium]|nr:response regulator [Bacteroidota bacterium]
MKKEKVFNTIERIMLIDDNEIDNFVSSRIMQQTDFANEILEYTSAREAFEFLEELGRSGKFNEVPSLILLDLNMPCMNGEEFVRKFQTLPLPVRQRTSIAILTSMFNPSEVFYKMKCPNVITCLSKPLMKHNLIELTECLGDNRILSTVA